MFYSIIWACRYTLQGVQGFWNFACITEIVEYMRMYYIHIHLWKSKVWKRQRYQRHLQQAETFVCLFEHILPIFILNNLSSLTTLWKKKKKKTFYVQTESKPTSGSIFNYLFTDLINKTNWHLKDAMHENTAASSS